MMMVHADVDEKSDALRRAWRTFGQGAVVSVLVSVGTYLTTLESEPDWKLVGISALQVAGTAIVTYLHNKVRPPV